MITDTTTTTTNPFGRSEADLQRLDYLGAALAVLMILGPLLTGAFRG